MIPILLIVSSLAILALVLVGNQREELKRLSRSLQLAWSEIHRLQTAESRKHELAVRAPASLPAATPKTTLTETEIPAPPIIPVSPPEVFATATDFVDPVLAQKETLTSPVGFFARTNALDTGSQTIQSPLRPAEASSTHSDQTRPAPESFAPAATPWNWEKFMGAKLFAWIGGLALFLGIAFFIKYSFENNLIPPALRVALGFVTGLGLVIGGLRVNRKDAAVTAQSLCASGVVILYAAAFAAHAYYNLIGGAAAFLLLAIFTAGAFFLSLYLDAAVVAVLGLLAGFLTPVLLSTGTDHAAALFTYIAFLDIGLFAIVFLRPWNYLTTLAALGTIALEFGWFIRFGTPLRAVRFFFIFQAFNALFLLSSFSAEKIHRPNPWFSASAVLPSVFSLTAVSLPLAALHPEHAVFLLSFIFVTDIWLLIFAVASSTIPGLLSFAGGLVFLNLSFWTAISLSGNRLLPALTAVLIYAALHTGFALWEQRVHPRGTAAAPRLPLFVFSWLGLLLLGISLFKLPEPSLLIWPAAMLLDLLAMALAIITGSAVAIAGALLLSAGLAGWWILDLPSPEITLAPVLAVISAFALLFLSGSFWVRAVIAQRRMVGSHSGTLPESLPRVRPVERPEDWNLLMAAATPFVLLLLIVGRVGLPNPSPVFAVAASFAVVLMATAACFQIELFWPLALAGTFGVELAWHAKEFSPIAPSVALVWYVLLYLFFTVAPFLIRPRLMNRRFPWITSALAGPLQFFLLYAGMRAAYPNLNLPGAIPALMALPMCGAFALVKQDWNPSHPERRRLLAWFGGSALYFITLIFPVEFQREWLTLGWAAEGAALLWLFWRVPHPGLRLVGAALLAIAFSRLAFNPAVFNYHIRMGLPLLNWYLYAYGAVALLLLTAGRLSAPPRDKLGSFPLQAVFYGLGTVLLFALLNLEIADYFADGPTLVFQFTGNFARDMAYSIGWALFAFALLLIGIWKRIAPARYASIGLLTVTLIKLFFHDLSRLGQLYRIGAFIGVAVVLILASYFYQRFLSLDAQKRGN